MESVVGKCNIFEHVFYEMQMYLYSLYKLSMFEQLEINTQLEYNLVWDTHFLHIRNLLDFFNCESDSITVDTILVNKKDFTISQEEFKYKQVINKTVDHLTIERVKKANKMSNLQLKVIKDMSIVIPERIRIFLDLLDDYENVKTEYKAHLSNEEIQELKKSIRTMMEWQ